MDDQKEMKKWEVRQELKPISSCWSWKKSEEEDEEVRPKVRKWETERELKTSEEETSQKLYMKLDGTFSYSE